MWRAADGAVLHTTASRVRRCRSSESVQGGLDAPSRRARGGLQPSRHMPTPTVSCSDGAPGPVRHHQPILRQRAGSGRKGPGRSRPVYVARSPTRPRVLLRVRLGRVPGTEVGVRIPPWDATRRSPRAPGDTDVLCEETGSWPLGGAYPESPNGLPSDPYRSPSAPRVHNVPAKVNNTLERRGHVRHPKVGQREPIAPARLRISETHRVRVSSCGEMPLETAWSRLALWRTVARMWHRRLRWRRNGVSRRFLESPESAWISGSM